MRHPGYTRKISRNTNRKKFISYIETALIASVFALVAVPVVKNVTADGDGGSNKGSGSEKYVVALNGEAIGYTDDAQAAKTALAEARTKLSSQSDGLVLVESDLSVTSVETDAQVLSEEELASDMYELLANNITDTADYVTAYTVRIDDFTVTVASKEEVTELLEKVKSKYTDSETFSVELVDNSNTAYNSLGTTFVAADKTVTEAAKVLASADGTEDALSDTSDEIVYADGVLSVDFAENIEIIETKAAGDNVVSVDEAYELITKEHAEKDTYTVVSGDCLSSIATKHNLTLDELLALNDGFTVDTEICSGDVLVVTVPASELSVVVVEEKSFDETYNAPVEYVDNPGLYTGTENVIQNAQEGTHSIVALVTYVNGVETERTIIKEELTKEAVPMIIERGTLNPPTYIKPVSGGSVTDGYGYRIHPIYGTYTLHSGTDWAVNMGTAVKAAAAGVVQCAGWNGAYGYCVDIKHADGSLTRYGHLSSIAVVYGQTVAQGEVIAYSGNTGNSAGPHLHFEIYINGCTVNPVDYVGY